MRPEAENAASRRASGQVAIHGFARAGFEAVREAFAQNFSRRNELGAACSIYQHGEKVVDLWGGIRNKATGEPWEEDTMVIVFSATRGLAAMAMAVAHSRGWLDYEERVSTYWPEFAQEEANPFMAMLKLPLRLMLAAMNPPLYCPELEVPLFNHVGSDDLSYTDASAPPPCPPAPQSRCGSDWASRGARRHDDDGRRRSFGQDVRMNDRAKSFVKECLTQGTSFHWAS